LFENKLKLLPPSSIEMLSGSGEKYLISKSKEAQNKDPCSAKAWILTAKTLYPNDFGVQVSIY
jgi:hypothetical protein